MARRYDSRTTTFSPDGRLFQVEYAMEAVGNAGSCLAILTSEGIVLGCERQSANKLLDDVFETEKVFRISEHMICGVAGLSSDANVLVFESRLITQRYLMQYGFDIPCEQLVKFVSDVKQQYTQYGGKRPFGASFIYVGWDESDGYQLYLSDPSGNYSGWKATCIGRDSAACISLLKQEYKDSMTLTSALSLATKVLAKSISSTKFRAESIELVTLVRDGEQTEVDVLGLMQLQKLVSAHKAEQDEAKQHEKAKAEGKEKMKSKPVEAVPGEKEKVEPENEQKDKEKHPEKMKARRKGNHKGSHNEGQRGKQGENEGKEGERINEGDRRGENVKGGKPEETKKGEEKDGKEQNTKKEADPAGKDGGKSAQGEEGKPDQERKAGPDQRTTTVKEAEEKPKE